MIGRLLCRLGRHAPAPDGLWNGGYCFTACRRCHRDMVRSAFGEWHVPRDFRIVWRPPEDGRTAPRQAAPAPSPVAPPARGGAPARLPRTGTRTPFDFTDFESETAAAASAPQRPAAARRRP